MNTILIQPFNVLVNGQVEQVNSIMFTNFCGYDFSGTNGGYVEYALGNFDGANFTPYNNGNCPVPYSVVSTWGADDNVIYDYVIQTKGFVKV